MKIIHCADLHLDSALTTHLPKEQAGQRRRELLLSFEKMLDYAKEQEVQALIIAGDLFDVRLISPLAKNTVLEGIKKHPQIDFFYLRGNHDGDLFSEEGQMPSNLKVFSENWQSYRIRDSQVVISGKELAKEPLKLIEGLSLAEEDFNIVVLHGQISQGQNQNMPENINLKELAYQHIDYLALGHLHAYQQGQLDERGYYCYSGCLEARGFDEIGPHGFVLLDIKTDGSFTQQLIPIGQRQFHLLETDISLCQNTQGIADKIETTLAEAKIAGGDMVKLVLTGQMEVGTEKDLDFLQEKFAPSYYYFKIYDQSKYWLDYSKYENEPTFRAELIRLIQSEQEFTEQEKAEMIQYGLAALAGEELL